MYRLRSGAILIVSVVLSCYAARAEEPIVRMAEVEAVQALEKLGALIEYDDQGYVELVELGVRENNFSDEHMQFVARFSRLRQLWLWHTKISDDGLVWLRKIPQLEVLGLITEYRRGRPSKITDAGMKHIAGMMNLKVLRLDDSDVTDAGLVHLKDLTTLEDLDLIGTEISDAGLVHLRGLKNLKYLNISETQWETRGGAISGRAANELRKHLPHCQVAE